MSNLIASSRGIVVAGTHSGVGKSSITLGLLRLLKRRKLSVQPFKVGPDYIDPQHHVRACGVPCYNLDTWMASDEEVQRLFLEKMRSREFAIVEGVMGLFDGVRPTENTGSAAQIARLLGLPVLLVFDGQAMARSAAALVKGFTELEPNLSFAGVVANRVNSPKHADLLRQAIEKETSARFLGCLPLKEEMKIKSRHLGLHQGYEQREDLYERWTDCLETHLDIERLIQTNSQGSASEVEEASSGVEVVQEKTFTVAVARDEAFQFVYQETLDFFERSGGQVRFFSPLSDSQLPPEADWVYLPGGYPELHASSLSNNPSMMTAVREFVDSGKPVVAECGGLMYLGQAIVDESGTEHPMAGVFNFSTSLTPKKLTIGYRKLVSDAHDPSQPPLTIRGHEFHSSSFVRNAETPHMQTFNSEDEPITKDGYRVKNCFAFYTHLYWPSAKGWLNHLLESAHLETNRIP